MALQGSGKGVRRESDDAHGTAYEPLELDQVANYCCCSSYQGIRTSELFRLAFQVDSKRTVRRVTRHLVTLFFILAIVCYLDRASLSFAASQLREDLHFSASTYGLGAGWLQISDTVQKLLVSLLHALHFALACRCLFCWLCLVSDSQQSNFGQSWRTNMAWQHACSLGMHCCLLCRHHQCCSVHGVAVHAWGGRMRSLPRYIRTIYMTIVMINKSHASNLGQTA